MSANTHFVRQQKKLLIANALLISLSISAFAQNQAYAQANDPNRLSAAQLTALVRSPGIGAKTTDATVVGTGPMVTVLADKVGTASDNDMKVDAIFLAKVLISGSAGQVQAVKVLFAQPDKQARFVMVDKNTVDGYASGKLSPEKLLASLTLATLVPEQAPQVADGPLMDRRLLIWRRIERLREQGTGVQPFQQIFQQIEKSLKTTDSTAISEKLGFLETKVKDQEEQVREAKKAQGGHGVPAAAHANAAAAQASAPVTPPPASGQPPGGPQSGPSTASNNRSPLWGQGGNGNNGPPMGFPPPPPGGWPQGGGPGPQGGGPGPQGGGPPF